MGNRRNCGAEIGREWMPEGTVNPRMKCAETLNKSEDFKQGDSVYLAFECQYSWEGL